MSAAVTDRDQLKQRLAEFLEYELALTSEILNQQFRNPGMFIQDVAGHVSRFQGKRIRPILTLLSARLFLSADPQNSQAELLRAAQLAAVVEMIHTATLVHDDVIDDAARRRHVSTVHRRWNTETSVLFGDYLLSRAFHLAALTGDAEACRHIGRATDKTCEGELNQIAARIEQSVSERDYFRVISGKTGQLFAVSCGLGARAARAELADQRRLRIFGMRLGLAFQIADDVTDLVASTDSTGKDAANDLANHRLTLPMIRALHLALPDERRRLKALLFSSDPEDHAQLRNEPLLQSGIESAKTTALHFVRRSMRCLTRWSGSAPAFLLEAIARTIVDCGADPGVAGQ